MTAQQIFDKHYNATVKNTDTIDPQSFLITYKAANLAMKEYAEQVAKQALEDAADNATCKSMTFDAAPFGETTIHDVDRLSILNTPIKLD